MSNTKRPIAKESPQKTSKTKATTIYPNENIPNPFTNPSSLHKGLSGRKETPEKRPWPHNNQPKNRHPNHPGHARSVKPNVQCNNTKNFNKIIGWHRERAITSWPRLRFWWPSRHSSWVIPGEKTSENNVRFLRKKTITDKEQPKKVPNGNHPPKIYPTTNQRLSKYRQLFRMTATTVKTPKKSGHGRTCRRQKTAYPPKQTPPQRWNLHFWWPSRHSSWVIPGEKTSENNVRFLRKKTITDKEQPKKVPNGNHPPKIYPTTNQRLSKYRQLFRMTATTVKTPKKSGHGRTCRRQKTAYPPKQTPPQRWNLHFWKQKFERRISQWSNQ